MGGGVFLNKNIFSKTKQGLVIGILLCSGIGNVGAITSNEITYNNNGVEGNLTETLDTLYTELKGYKTGGNVTPSEMLEGSSGYSKGVLVTGSIKKKEATTYTPGVNNITIPKGQYLNGDQIILGDSNLKSENIKSGVSIFGIPGSIKDNSGKTLEATNVTNDTSYTYLNIPEEAIYNTSSVIKVANNELLKDGWMDITDQCWWQVNVLRSDGLGMGTWLRYNKFTKQIIGHIHLNPGATVKNQQVLVLMPYLEGLNNGMNPFTGVVGQGFHQNTDLEVLARAAGNEIISSHNHDIALESAYIDYSINFIAM